MYSGPPDEALDSYCYSQVREGYSCEPESCVHDIAQKHHPCPDCGLSGVGRQKERELREQGWTVAEIADLGLMDA